MAPYFPDEKIAAIKEASSIVDVVSDYMSLKKSGKNYTGLCPFHSEKTPSFMVNEGKQIFHCFGCNTGGNVFTFVMKMDHLSFPEAVIGLARRYGIDLPRATVSDTDKKEVLKREKLFELNKLACRYFHTLLMHDKEGEDARRYFSKRGLSKEVITHYKLGYAVNSWDGLLSFLSKKNVPLELAEEVGLIIPKKGRGYYDRFRGRIVFPIIDASDRVIGFGGRVLENSLPKYLNSPESSVYSKSTSLYGINIAKEFVRKQDSVLIVEGYFDLLSLHQYGVKNAVATLGTSLTSGHIGMLKRYTKNIVTIFDADEAGERAATRSLDFFLKHHISAKVVTLPSGFDPDSFIRQERKKDFERKIEEALPILEFVINATMKKHDSSSIEGKIKIIEEIEPILSEVENALELEFYVRKISKQLDMKEDSLFKQFSRKKKESYSKTEDVQFMREDLAERFLLKLMLLKDNNVICRIQEEGVVEDYTNKEYKKVGLFLLDVFNREGKVDLPRIIGMLEDESSRSIVSQLSVEEESIVDIQKTLKNCVYKVRMNKMKQERKLLDIKIKEAEEKKDDVRLRECMFFMKELMDKEREYRQAFSNFNA